MIRGLYIAVLLMLVSLSGIQAQVLPFFGDSRTGTTGFQFLKIAPDARSSGMAGAYIAVGDDPSALFWNPARITQVDTQSWHLQSGFVSYFSGIKMSYGVGVYRINSTMYAGVQLTGLTTGDMDVTTEFMPFGTGQTFRASDVALGVTFAQILTESFSYGATVKYARESIAGINSNAFMLDFGFAYDVGKANTRFAVSVSNFGLNTKPKGEVQVENLTGTSTESDFETITVPAVFRLGMAWDAVKKESHLFTLAAQLNHPTDNNETYALGTEYVWKQIAFFRAGYEFGVDEKGLPAFGFGLQYKRRFGMIRIDYGFNDKKALGSIHRISLGLSLF